MTRFPDEFTAQNFPSKVNRFRFSNASINNVKEMIITYLLHDRTNSNILKEVHLIFDTFLTIITK